MIFYATDHHAVSVHCNIPGCDMSRTSELDTDVCVRDAEMIQEIALELMLWDPETDGNNTHPSDGNYLGGYGSIIPGNYPWTGVHFGAIAVCNRHNN